MSKFLALAYLFFLGSLLGYIIEVIYRRFAPNNKTGKWINPGFCIGPYLPIYGFALCMLFSLAIVGKMQGWDDTLSGKIFLFIFMALCITVMEYIAGEFCLRVFNVRLWDYRKEFLNLNGHICLKFTFFWWLLSALYYFLIDERVVEALIWLHANLGFLFVVGFFFGVFTIDIIYSGNLMIKMRRFAKKNKIVVAHDKLVDFAKDKWGKIMHRKNIHLERIRALDALGTMKNVGKAIKNKVKA